MKRVPIFLFNGLLESGKTAFINQLLKKPVFHDGNKTVVISCEEGEMAYQEKEMCQSKITLVKLSEETDFVASLIQKINLEECPERVIIEYNGMWDVTRILEMEWPKGWFLYQMIVLVNGETYQLYMDNMRSLMLAHTGYADLIIFNRLSQKIKETYLTGNIKAVNPTVKVYEADSQFRLTPIQGELPYDMRAEVIDISKENYGVWYIDLWDTPQRYTEKKVRVRGLFFKQPTDLKGYFSLGRLAMPCCEEDITVMGVYCYYPHPISYVDQDSIEVVAKICYEKQAIYQGEIGPVLYVETIKKTAINQADWVVFN